MPILEAATYIAVGLGFVVLAWALSTSASKRAASSDQPARKSRIPIRVVGFVLLAGAVVFVAVEAGAVGSSVEQWRVMAQRVLAPTHEQEPGLQLSRSADESVTIGREYVEVRGVPPNETAYVSFVSLSSESEARSCEGDACDVLSQVVDTVRSTRPPEEPVAASIVSVATNEHGVGRASIPNEFGLTGVLFSDNPDQFRIVVATQDSNGELMLSNLSPGEADQATWYAVEFTSNY